MWKTNFHVDLKKSACIAVYLPPDEVSKRFCDLILIAPSTTKSSTVGKFEQTIIKPKICMRKRIAPTFFTNPKNRNRFHVSVIVSLIPTKYSLLKRMSYNDTRIASGCFRRQFEYTQSTRIASHNIPYFPGRLICQMLQTCRSLIIIRHHSSPFNTNSFFGFPKNLANNVKRWTCTKKICSAYLKTNKCNEIQLENSKLIHNCAKDSEKKLIDKYSATI
ncbi:Uncharacterized protein FWK35_00028870 [Aphis craccivora]|uniref:Uncharacterized protein n=1 Tax=Aphis craccivora TaxID=307492 RepID=A0A6G0VT85_APHCR|nr:Uncharacterized protein FWK35_00028870 [Aphis craccivora]